MCGVIGVHLSNPDKYDLELAKALFVQSMIRGKHATGVTYLVGSDLVTIKEPIPADEFVEKYDVREFINPATGDLTFIGHIRYSTSDLRYNQPFQGKGIANTWAKGIAIAHNGVISQDPDIWEYETETSNDSELILRCIEAGDCPIEVYRHRSMACVALEDGVLHGWRNHERPLWMALRRNGLIFASTRDIIRRCGIVDHISQCEPLVRYQYNVGEKSVNKNFGHVWALPGLWTDHMVQMTYPEIEDLQPDISMLPTHASTWGLR